MRATSPERLNSRIAHEMNVGSEGMAMKPLKSLPSSMSPAAMGMEIQSLLMTNPKRAFLIRRDGDIVTVWDTDERTEQ